MGVAGTLLVPLLVAGPGAGGGAGVDCVTGAGVEGGFGADDDEADEAAGVAVFGYSSMSTVRERKPDYRPSGSCKL